MPAVSQKSRHDAASVKPVANGQWDAIIASVASVPVEILDTAHHPCPKCGGTDRFRWTNPGNDGGAICNHCGKFGDGFEVVQWLTGLSFADAVDAVGEYLRLEPGKYSPDQGKGADPRAVPTEKPDPAKSLVFRGCSMLDGVKWQKRKPGCTFLAARRAGGQFATYGKSETDVLAFPIYGPKLISGGPVGWVMWATDPQSLLPVFGRKGSGHETTFAKVKITFGSDHGFVNTQAISILSDQTKQKTVVGIHFVEGVSDLNALMSLVPAELQETHLVLTNSNGAGEKLAQWMIDLVLSCENLAWVNVIRDCDTPGQEGALGRLVTTGATPKWAPGWCDILTAAIKSAGRSVIVRNVVLPYEITENHGNDLRDWITSPKDVPFDPDRDYAGFMSLVENCEPHEANELYRPAIQQKPSPPGQEESSPAAVESRNRQDSADPSEIPDDAIVNGIPGVITDKKTGEPKETIIPLPMSAIIARIKLATKGWPRRIGQELFVHNEESDEPVSFLRKPEALIGYAGSVGPRGCPRIYNGPGFHTKAEIHAEMCRTAQEYKAIETVPHEPQFIDHYYACKPIKPGTGLFLEKFISLFSPETAADRDLIIVMVATTIWGGPPGDRPMFVITSKDGRGVGKTTLAQYIGILTGQYIMFKAGEELENMLKRFLSPDGAKSRVAILDNLKTHRFSWADLESLITSSQISGHKLFVGESVRPNLYTWIATLNGPALSTDIAQRSVIIRVNRSVHSPKWKRNAQRFIAENAKNIIADIISFLRRESFPLTGFSRWSEWEDAVLSKLQDPTAAQQAIKERQHSANVEDEEGEIITDFIQDKIASLYYGEDDFVFIPSVMIAEWYSASTRDRHTTTAVSRILKQRIEEGTAPQLIVKKHQGGRRGFIWRTSGHLGIPFNEKTDTLYEDIDERIREEKRKERDSYKSPY